MINLMASNIRNLGFIIILLMVLLTTALVVSWSTEKALAKQVVILTPRISLSLEHDDNIYFSQNNAVSDFITYVAPGLHSELITPQGAGSIDYEMQGVSYLHHSSSNSIRHYLSMDGWGNLPWDWRLSFEDNYIRSEDPTQIEHAISGIRYENLEYDYNEGNVDLTRTFGMDSYLSLGYRNMFFQNRSSYASDSVSHYPYLDVLYWLSRPTGLQMECGENFANFDYSDDFRDAEVALSLLRRLDMDTTVSLKTALSHMNFQEDTPDYVIYDLGVGLDRIITGNSGIGLGAGYYFQNNEQGISDEEGLSGYLSYWHRGPGHSISIEASKGFDEIYFDGEDLGFSECWVAGGSFKILLNHGVSLGLDSSYRENTFPQAPEEVKEKTRKFSCHADWMVNTWCKISLAYSHWNRDANVPDYEYQDNRLLLGITFAKGFVW